MANVTYDATNRIFTGGTEADPITPFRFHTNEDGTEVTSTPFSTAYGNAAIMDNTSSGGDFLGVGATSGNTKTYLDMTDNIVIMQKGTNSSNSGSLLELNEAGVIVVDADTTGTIVLNDIGHSNPDPDEADQRALFTNGSVLDIGEGGRLIYKIPLIPLTSSGEESAARNYLRTNLTTSDSNARVTFATGPYAMDSETWDSRVSSAVKSSGGKYLGSAVFYYGVTDAVLVRDFLYQGGYVDWRPGATFAAPNGGGFEAISGIKMLSAAFNETITDAAPLFFGGPDADFLMQIEETETNSSGKGYIEYAVLSNAGNATRTVFQNYKGAGWGTQLAVFTADPARASRLENHIFPGITTITSSGEDIEGTEIIYHSRFPSYDVEANSGTSITFPAANAATYTGFTDSDGFVRLGNPNGSRGATDNGIILEAFTRFGNSGNNVDTHYSNASAANADYASYATHTYDIFRLGYELIVNQTVFEKAIALAGGKPEIGNRTLPVDTYLSAPVSNQVLTADGTQTSFTITDTTATTVQAFQGGTQLTIQSISAGTITFATAPAAGSILFVGVLFPTTAATLDETYDLAYEFRFGVAKLGYALQGDGTTLEANGFTNLSFSKAGGAISSSSDTLTVKIDSGCPTTTDQFTTVKASNNVTFDGTITCGVDASNILFESDVSFTDGVQINTTEAISGTHQLSSGSDFYINGADCDDFTLNLASGTANVILTGGATTPKTSGSGVITFLQGATLTFDVGGAYDSTKSTIVILQKNGGVYTEKTDDIVTSNGGTSVTFSFNFATADTLAWAFAYDGFEIETGTGTDVDVNLTSIPVTSLSFTTDISAYSSLITNDVASDTNADTLAFTLPAQTSTTTLTDAESRLFIRRLMETDTPMQQFAKHASAAADGADPTLISYSVTGLVISDSDKVDFNQATSSFDFNLQVEALSNAGADVSKLISTGVSATLIRFNQKSTVIFTSQSVFDAVLNGQNDHLDDLVSDLEETFIDVISND